MNLKKTKKGFTLVELLAVIVILSVIILIAATNVGGITNNAKKNTLASEGNTMVDSAKLAYEFLEEEGELEYHSQICIGLSYLYRKGYSIDDITSLISSNDDY